MKTKGLKKGIALFLAAVMTLGLCIIPVPAVQAEENMQDSGITITITTDKKEVKRGDIITLTASLKGIPADSGIYSTVFKAVYNSSVVEPVKIGNNNWDIETGDAIPNNMTVLSNINEDTEDVRVAALDFTMTTFLKDGVLLSGKFKVKEDASGGAFDFVFPTENDGIQLCNTSGELLPYTLDDQTKGMQVGVPVTGIKLDRISMSLKKDETAKLTAALLPEGSTGTIEWKSSNDTVASVGQDGTVTAKNSGTAKITATVNGISASCDVTVTNPLTGIEITAPDGRHNLDKGQTLQLSVVPIPEDADGEIQAAWTSTNPDAATVSENGLVTAVADGKTTITAEAGGFKATYDIEVKEIPLTGIELNKTETTIHRGESEKLIATPDPADTTDDTRVKWETSDKSIAIVDGDGNVTAVGIGKATITATIGNFSKTCAVTVDAPLKAIKPDQTEMELLKGQTAHLGYTLEPADTTDRDVTMTSSNDEVVTVDPDGTLTAIKAGTAAITLAGENNVTATVTVTVKELPVEGVALDKSSAKLEKGESTTLAAKVLPENTTDTDKSITWSSSDESVAAVSAEKTESGESITVTATDKGGKAVITAEAANGAKAECQIYVPIHIEGIELADAEVLRGNTVVMQDYVTFIPANADDDRTLTWESSDPEIASIDPQTGMLTALKEGTVTITATTVGTKVPLSDTAEVRVKENHLTEEIAKNIQFDKMKDAVLKGQKVYMNELLNLDSMVEKEHITDNITLEWSSEDTSVATVDQSGCLTGLKEGKTVVTVQITATDGSGKQIGKYTVETEVQVKEIPLESIAFDKIIREMTVGEKAVLSVIYNPENTTDVRDVIWSTSDASVLSVKNGEVTALKSGKATITAKVGKTASVSMEITVKSKQISDKAPGTPDKGGSVLTGVYENPSVYAAGVLLAAAAALIITVWRRKFFR